MASPTRTSAKKPPRVRNRTAAPKGGSAKEAEPRQMPDIKKLLEDWQPKGVHAKLAFIQAYVPSVEETGHVEMKTQKGGTVKYDHMQEHGLLECLRPFFRELRCGYYPDFTSVTHSGNHTFIEGTLTFFDGDGKEPFAPEGAMHMVPAQTIVAHFHNEGIDVGDKGTNKAKTAWTKYALQKFFAIPTKDVADTEGTPDVSTATAQPAKQSLDEIAEVTRLRDELTAAVGAGDLTNNRIQALMQGTYGVSRLEELTSTQRESFSETLLGPKG